MTTVNWRRGARAGVFLVGSMAASGCTPDAPPPLVMFQPLAQNDLGFYPGAFVIRASAAGRPYSTSQIAVATPVGSGRGRSGDHFSDDRNAIRSRRSGRPFGGSVITPARLAAAQVMFSSLTFLRMSGLICFRWR